MNKQSEKSYTLKCSARLGKVIRPYLSFSSIIEVSAAASFAALATFAALAAFAAFAALATFAALAAAFASFAALSAFAPQNAEVLVLHLFFIFHVDLKKIAMSTIEDGAGSFAVLAVTGQDDHSFDNPVAVIVNVRIVVIVGMPVDVGQAAVGSSLTKLASVVQAFKLRFTSTVPRGIRNVEATQQGNDYFPGHEHDETDT